MKEKKFVTLKEIAKLAETSIATVSCVLNGTEKRYIKNELRNRVLEAAKQLNYQKSSIASSLKGKKIGVIAVVVPQFENYFFTRIISEIDKIAFKNGFSLMICNTFDDSLREKAVLEKLLQQRVDGIILAPSEKGEFNLDMLARFDIPLVVAERPCFEKSISSISTDNYNGGYLLTKKLIEDGHKKIAFIGWKTEISNINFRKHGYLKALEEGKLTESFIYETDLEIQEGRRLTEKLLAEKEITAILYAHHIFAEGGLSKIRELKESISVTMIGNPSWTNYIEIDIPRIDQRESEVGRKSIEVLLKQIQTGEKNIINEIVEPRMLIGHEELIR